jgi:hypothetical protein
MNKPRIITDEEIYAEQRCTQLFVAQSNRSNESPARILFVEGPDDVRLYGSHVRYLYGPKTEVCSDDNGILSIQSASADFARTPDWRPKGAERVGKKWVEEQLKDERYRSNNWDCRGIVDKDFDSSSALEGEFQGLGVTDTHDSETLVFSSFREEVSAVSCLCESGVFQKDKVSSALRLSFELGLLKWISTSLQESHYCGFFRGDGPRNERLLSAIKQVLITTEDKKIPSLVDGVYASLIKDGHVSIENIFYQYAFDLARENSRASSHKYSDKCLEEFFGQRSICREYASQACVQKMIAYLSSNSLFSEVWMDSDGRWLTSEITFENALGGIGPAVFDVCNGHDLERFLQVEFHDPFLDLSGALKNFALMNLQKSGNNTPLFGTHLFKKITDKW